MGNCLGKSNTDNINTSNDCYLAISDWYSLGDKYLASFRELPVTVQIAIMKDTDSSCENIIDITNEILTNRSPSIKQWYQTLKLMIDWIKEYLDKQAVDITINKLTKLNIDGYHLDQFKLIQIYARGILPSENEEKLIRESNISINDGKLSQSNISDVSNVPNVPDRNITNPIFENRRDSISSLLYKPSITSELRVPARNDKFPNKSAPVSRVTSRNGSIDHSKSSQLSKSSWITDIDPNNNLSTSQQVTVEL